MNIEKIINKWTRSGLLGDENNKIGDIEIEKHKISTIAMAYEFMAIYLLTGERNENISDWSTIESSTKLKLNANVDELSFPAIAKILTSTPITKEVNSKDVWDFVVDMLTELDAFVGSIRTQDTYIELAMTSVDADAYFFTTFCNKFNATKYFN